MLDLSLLEFTLACAETANGNAFRLVRGENAGYVSIGFCLPPIDVSERLAGVVNVEFHKVELVRVMERGFTSCRIFSNAESG